MADLRVDDEGTKFIAGWEQFVPYCYDDKARPVMVGNKRMPPRWAAPTPVLGTLTVGFGHTNAALFPAKVEDYITNDMTLEEAYAVLDGDLGDVEKDVNSTVKVPITQQEFDALCSLCFNLGGPHFKNSTLISKLNRKDYVGARAAFGLYVSSGGEVMRGLQNRRAAEQVLWDKGTPLGTDQTVPVPDPVEDHFVPTPKNVDPSQPVKPMSASTIGGSQIAIGAGTAVTTVGAVVKSATDSVPVDHVEHVTKVIDTTGRVVASVKNVTDNVPDVDAFHKIIHVATDPWIMGIIGTLVIGFAAYTWFERRRQSNEGNF